MASNVEIIVSATDKASSTLRGIGGSMDALGSIGKVAATGFAVLSAAVAAAGAALAGFVSAAASAEESTARFNAIVGSSKLSNMTDEMQKMAGALSQVTRFEDENILEAEAMLSLYQNIGEDIFPQVTETALDLAEVLKTDATGGAEMLGRALSDIAEGSLMMLARQRLITKEQQEFAENLAKTGDEAGAQAYILDILNGKIGDLAETMGKTFSGSMTIFKNNLGNVAEELGGPLLDALTPVIDELNTFVTKIAPVLKYAFDKYIVPAISSGAEGFVKFIKSIDISKIIEFVVGIKNLDWSGVRESLTAIDWGAMSQRLIEGIQAIDWNSLGRNLGELLKTVVVTAIDIASEVDWGGLFKSLGKALADFATGLGGGTVEEFIAVWSGNLYQLADIIQQVADIILTRIGQFAAIGRAIIAAIRTSIATGWNGLIVWIASKMNEIAGLFNRVVLALSMKITDFVIIGQALVSGLKAGIQNAWGAFEQWFIGILQKIIDTVLGTLGISSPSKVFAGIGKNLMLGLAEGIGGGLSIPINTLNNLPPKLAMATANGFGVAGQSISSTHNYYGARVLISRDSQDRWLSELTE